MTLSVQLSSSHCSHDRHLQDVNKGYLLVNVQNRVTGTPVSQSTYLLYGVSFPIVMGKRSASLSSALTQIRSPHGPLLNSTTWRTLGGTATDTRHEPSALTQKTKYRNQGILVSCYAYKLQDVFFINICLTVTGKLVNQHNRPDPSPFPNGRQWIEVYDMENCLTSQQS